MKKADIGLIGLAVMGENLVMNMESKGFTVAVFNRTTSKVDDFVNGRAKGKNIIGTHTLQELADNLEKPRKVMMMVKAGQPVDDFIENLLGVLEPGDVIIDGGNSHFPDTIRRTEYVESRGLLYIGTGVSGGEEGALKGPSMMPGGSPEAWEEVKPIFQSICAHVEDGSACCEWVGENGAGHFVKMVHNGIEYGDMELICEAFQLMRDVLGLGADEMQKIFAKWNETELDSYLIEITGDILGYKDEDGTPIVDKILDTAGQKGTGKWTSIAALDEGYPLTLISSAVFARCLSAMKDERVIASEAYGRKVKAYIGDKEEFIEKIMLVNAGFDDRLMEYAKFQLFQNCPGQLDHEKHRLLFDFSNKEDNLIKFVVFDKENGKHIAGLHIERKDYEAMDNEFKNTPTLQKELDALFPNCNVTVDRVFDF